MVNIESRKTSDNIRKKLYNKLGIFVLIFDQMIEICIRSTSYLELDLAFLKFNRKISRETF